MNARRVIGLVLASIIAVIGVVGVAVGSIVGWTSGTQRDDAGFFTTPVERFETTPAPCSSASALQPTWRPVSPRFAAHPVHVDVMRRQAPHLGAATFATRPVHPVSDLG